MKQTDIWSYIWIGTCLRYLQDQTAGVPIHREDFTLDNIASFLSSLDSLSLHVTRRASVGLEEIQRELTAMPPGHVLTQEEAERLNGTASQIRMTFEAETRGVFSYAVTDKRIDVRKLLESVGELFAPGTYGTLPEIARFDYAEAGKCIAFERSTAAAFHILRATEDVVRLFYRRHIRPAKADLTWGQMTTALRQKTKGRIPDPIVLNQLDHIRNAFRNPTQHPNKIYDIQEVQDLFGLCVDVANRMSAAFSK